VFDEVSEAAREGFLADVVQVGLLAEEHDFVIEKRAPNRVDGLLGQVAAEAHARDLGTDAPGDTT
jgi:hypothetical protein